MSEEIFENNNVVVGGMICEEFDYSHETYGEKFYVTHIESTRTSGVNDIIPVMVSERLVSVDDKWIGQFVKVYGQFRSFDMHEGNKNRLILYVFARDFEILEEREDENQIFLDGFICKDPVYRPTPFGREISDVLLAINRQYGRTDYIPCILWGRNARYISTFQTGTQCNIWGRIQSREYTKIHPGGHEEIRTVYEVSGSKILVPKKKDE